MKVYEHITQRIQKGEKLLICLLDPEKTPISEIEKIGVLLRKSAVDYIFVGGSGYEGNLDEYILALRAIALPVIIFPGALTQVSKEADGLLFLSLLSSTNADWIIHNQAKAVEVIRREGLETMGVGYIVINTGSETSVERVTGEKGVPETAIETIVHIAMAAEMMGFSMLYLEAGSGAKHPIKPETIIAVRENTHIPIIVGGGICKQTQLSIAYEAGADMVVIGNHFERHPEDIATFTKTQPL